MPSSSARGRRWWTPEVPSETVIYVLAKVGVEGFDRFFEVFSTRGVEKRQGHGCVGSQVFRVTDQEGQVVVLLTWPSREAFEAFRNDPTVRETMQSGGTLGPPEFTILEKAGEFPH